MPTQFLTRFIIKIISKPFKQFRLQVEAVVEMEVVVVEVEIFTGAF